MRPLPGLVGLCLLGSLPALADPPTPPRLERYHAEGVFIDDPFALSADGARLAWITTDGATHADVHLASPGRKGELSFPSGGINPERVVFLDAERVLVVDRNPETGFARGEVFGPTGRDKVRLGPVGGIALATVQGTAAIVTYTRANAAKGSVRHDFVAVRRDTLKPLARKTLVESGGRIALDGGQYKPLFFEDGYAVLVAQKEGSYDKAHDIRKPDLEARLDVFAGTLVGEREIKDLVAWTQLIKAREKHTNEARFVRFSEDLHRLELVDGDHVAELETPRPLGKYDPLTLAWQPLADGLALSLTIDPVNPEAVRAQKADKDWLDVYRLDVKTKALTGIVRLDGEKRPTAWHLAGGRLAVLRKHKGFGRGGADLDVFEFAPPAEKKAAPATTPTTPTTPTPTTPTTPTTAPAPPKK
jgi:hypothetical protein